MCIKFHTYRLCAHILYSQHSIAIYESEVWWFCWMIYDVQYLHSCSHQHHHHPPYLGIVRILSPTFLHVDFIHIKKIGLVNATKINLFDIFFMWFMCMCALACVCVCMIYTFCSNLWWYIKYRVFDINRCTVENGYKCVVYKWMNNISSNYYNSILR